MAAASPDAVARPPGGWTGPVLAFTRGVGAFDLRTEPVPWVGLLTATLAFAATGMGWRGRGRTLRAAAWARLIGLACAQNHACLTLCHPLPEHYARSELTGWFASGSCPRPVGLR